MAIAASSANAASYSFNFVYNGSSLTETGPDTMAGTMLDAGDTLTIDIVAAGNSFWTWTGGSSQTLPLNPVANAGSTFQNATLNLLLDGGVVLTDSESNNGRCCADIGMDSLSGLTSGLEYDALSFDYELLSITSGTPVELVGGFFFDNLWADATYTDIPAAAVPLPASGVLLGAMLLAGGAAARRRKKAEASA